MATSMSCIWVQGAAFCAYSVNSGRWTAADDDASTRVLLSSGLSRLGWLSYGPLKLETNSRSAACRIVSTNFHRNDFSRMCWSSCWPLEWETNCGSAARGSNSTNLLSSSGLGWVSPLKSKTNSRAAARRFFWRRQVIAAAEVVKQVQFPPSDYDFRAEIMEETMRVIESTYPELLDLVEDGALVVVQRPADYVERRSDGYREPDMVFVVGTAHMSLLSASQVERVIRAVRPENVVVELCRSRAGIMFPPEEDGVESSRNGQTTQNKRSKLMSMSGDNFRTAMSWSLRVGGRSALALRLLLGGISEKLSKSTGVATGEEFRAARKAAEEVGAQLVLGDRPIEVTLKRAWEALKWEERYRLATIFLQAMNSSFLDDVSEEVLETLKSDDALSQMFAEMGSRLPSLLQPLIYERDMYLAWSLKRSKAVNGCSRVVGVVGKGHLRGVIFNLKHDQENLRFRDLVGPRSARSPSAAGNLVEGSQQTLQEFVRRLFHKWGAS